ncbi:MAG: GAF domain-containing sensor histidine kinase [Fulvivirga sp.]|nr:GAF domain-containing sensor histidine kinase [Fulvivirga sp.]
MKQNNSSREEQARVDILEQYGILDTPQEESFNDIVELASEICETPISLISLLDSERQWFKAKKGLDINETKREIAFCNHAIRQNKLFEVEDTKNDDRFRNNPLVTEQPHLRAYAGYPLKTSDGYNIGTLCVLDRKPRKLNKKQKKALEVLAKRVVNEIELKYRIKQLKELNKFKERLLAILGHDLRSPLNSIQSIIKLIDDEMLKPDEIKMLRQRLKSDVSSAQNLLENILSWSVLHLERDMNKEHFKLLPLIEECLKLLHTEIEHKQLNIALSKADVETFGEPEMIKLVIRNILSNAVKFSPAKGTINVEIHKGDNFSEIRISDEGAGMKQEQIDKILQKEKVASTLGTAKESGAGIGLMLSQEFLEANNGRLAIESEPDAGSTFIIRMPISQ